jgi:CSLREA domain-containing protein
MHHYLPLLPRACQRAAASLLIPASLCFASVSWAATITVNSTADVAANDGVCTLREAITAANTDTASGAAPGECAAGSGADDIVFNIPGAGAKLIATTAVLPIITTTVRINGYTQPGASANSNGPGLGSNAVFMIEIDHGAVANNFTLQFSGAGAANSIVEGLTLSRSANAGCCANIGIYISNTTGVWVRGNLFGTNVTATTVKDFQNRAVYIDNNTSGVIIGSGPAALVPAYRNVFSAAAGMAIASSGTPTALTIRGNFIGTTPAGNAVLAASAVGTGISLDNTVGATLVSDNVIAGAAQGMRVRYSNGAIIENNLIGVAVDGVSALGNGGGGGIVLLDTNGVAFTSLTIRTNTIANNAGPGVVVQQGNAANVIRGIVISQNIIHSNTGSEIDLTNSSSADGTTANDPLDVDTGANNLQNYPLLAAATGDGASVSVPFTFNSEPNQNFVLEFFRAPACDASGHGGATTYLGLVNVTTDAAGNAAGTASLASGLTSGAISATATHAVNGTSEFSACATLSAAAAVNVTLTVTKSGTGSGTVSGTGINCGADCSESVVANTVIVLTATPAVGSTFVGWSGGGCSGTAACSVTVSTAVTVNAQLDLVPPPSNAALAIPTLQPALLAWLGLALLLVAAVAARSASGSRQRP